MHQAPAGTAVQVVAPAVQVVAPAVQVVEPVVATPNKKKPHYTDRELAELCEWYHNQHC